MPRAFRYHTGYRSRSQVVPAMRVLSTVDRVKLRARDLIPFIYDDPVAPEVVLYLMRCVLLLRKGVVV